jgi:RHS repeat-associated protein
VSNLTTTLASTPTEPPPAPFTGAYYTYDGDDNMVKSVVNGITTYYAASSYVVETDGITTTVRKTYLAGSTSLAVRTIINGTQNTLNWTLSDHLGSSSVTTTANGTWYSELRYSAFGETRYSSGITPTDYRYTGQLEQADVNLYYYNARWYDPALGRFIQADTIVPEPGSAKSYDRYMYVNNNPVRYTDPSGHIIPDEIDWPWDRGYKPATPKAPTPTPTPTPKAQHSILTGYVFILSCGQNTSCTGNSPKSQTEYNNQVPLQPLAEMITNYGGTVIYAGEQGSVTNKLAYKEEIKSKILANKDAKGIFLIGHSFGAGANILSAYELMYPTGETRNLAGIVTLDSYLLTGSGEGIILPSGDDPTKYDTQDKADYVLNLIPSYTAHSSDHADNPYISSDFPRVGMGIGPELSSSHTMLANSTSMTKNVFSFLFLEVITGN